MTHPDMSTRKRHELGNKMNNGRKKKNPPQKKPLLSADGVQEATEDREIVTPKVNMGEGDIVMEFWAQS